MALDLKNAAVVGLLSLSLVGLGVTAVYSSVADDDRETGKAEGSDQATDAVGRENPRRHIVESRSRVLELQQLQALGYVDGTYDPEHEKTNVLKNIKARTHPGYNFYTSRMQPGALLIDMDGRAVHEWRTNRKGGWHHAHLFPNGDVLAIVKDVSLSRYDRDSNLIWSVPGRFHHDLWIDGDEIYALTRRNELVKTIHPRVKTLVDFVQVLSLDGELKREISVLDLFRNSQYRFLLPQVPKTGVSSKQGSLDILHTNHVEVFDGSLAHRHPMYAKGNILLSMRNINTVAIWDPRASEFAWIWGPSNLTFQHQPTLLNNGNILVFDNGTKRSRILEVDPVANEIAWSYAPKSGFYSQTRGSNQRLPNGNTLITESDRGYVLEVTPRGRVVWKFANPIVNRRKQREAIWRMTRVDPQVLTFLDG